VTFPAPPSVPRRKSNLATCDFMTVLWNIAMPQL